MTTEKRQQLIRAISEASRRPCPDISEIRHCRHKVTGKVHSPFGMPFGFKCEDYETISMGHAYRDANGTTYGTAGKSATELRERWEAGQVRSVAEFARQLVDMSETQLESQAAYWLKLEVA